MGNKQKLQKISELLNKELVRKKCYNIYIQEWKAINEGERNFLLSIINELDDIIIDMDKEWNYEPDNNNLYLD